ncbi:MAG: hypothetical protein ACKOQM_01365 [Novosphingobium sp.]
MTISRTLSNRAVGFAAMAALLYAPVAIAKDKIVVDPAELAKAQSHDFSASSDVCYMGTVAAFQQLSYDILLTDKTTGLVKAQSVGKGHVTYNLLFGFGSKKKIQGVTALIEAASPQSCHISLNYVLTTKKSSLYGSRGDDGEPIQDIALYNQTFDAIGAQISQRVAAAVPTPAAAPATAPAPASVAAPSGN